MMKSEGLSILIEKDEYMHRKSTQKEIISDKETTIDGIPASVTVKEITRHRYNKSTWYGYGVTVTFDDRGEAFTHRNTIEKSKLHRTFTQRFFDSLLDRDPITSLSEFIIQVTHTAASEYRDEYDELSLEDEVEATLAAV